MFKNDFLKSKLATVWTKKPQIHVDHRGRFLELSRSYEFEALDISFKQIGVSINRKNVLKGMHAQQNQWQLITLLQGEILDFQLDVSMHSETFGKTQRIRLSANEYNQILTYPGVFHGFKTLTDDCIIHYQSNVIYGETAEFGINFAGIVDFRDIVMDDLLISKRDLNFSNYNQSDLRKLSKSLMSEDLCRDSEKQRQYLNG